MANFGRSMEAQQHGELRVPRDPCGIVHGSGPGHPPMAEPEQPEQQSPGGPRVFAVQPVIVRSAAESRAVFRAGGALDCDCHENYHAMGVHAPDWVPTCDSQLLAVMSAPRGEDEVGSRPSRR